MQAQHTVLVIDDNPLIRKHYRDFLQTEAFFVVEAGNGAEALIWFWRGTADIIILDLEMPVMDGRSFLEYRLRAPNILDIPVLVVGSTLDDTSLCETLLRLGADLLFQRPVTRDDLLGSLRKFLAKPGISDVARPMQAQEGGGRQDARVAFTVPIRVRTPSSLAASGSSRDLSAGGLAAYLPLRLIPGEAVTVSLDMEGGSLALAGFVQWVGGSLTAMGCCHGIRFIDRQAHSFPLYMYSFFRERPNAPT